MVILRGYMVRPQAMQGHPQLWLTITDRDLTKMTLLQILVLAVIQGAAELLPVSALAEGAGNGCIIC